MNKLIFITILSMLVCECFGQSNTDTSLTSKNGELTQLDTVYYSLDTTAYRLIKTTHTKTVDILTQESPTKSIRKTTTYADIHFDTLRLFSIPKTLTHCTGDDIKTLSTRGKVYRFFEFNSNFKEGAYAVHRGFSLKGGVVYTSTGTNNERSAVLKMFIIVLCILFFHLVTALFIKFIFKQELNSFWFITAFISFMLLTVFVISYAIRSSDNPVWFTPVLSHLYFWINSNSCIVILCYVCVWAYYAWIRLWTKY